MRIKYRKIFFAAEFVVVFTAALLICALMPRHTAFKIETQKPKITQNNYSILIDTQEKILYLLNNDKLVKKYKCAVGKPSTPSPLGSYHIIKKSHWGEGFGGYWLGIDCPWGVYGIHGTLNPDSVGFSLSHGCFRMYNSDIAQLYKIVPVGTPVCITGGIYGAFGQDFRSIGPGMYGRDVQVIQIRLKDLGYFKGTCNGLYNTAGFIDAVFNFQHDFGLPESNYIDKEMLSKLGFVLME